MGEDSKIEWTDHTFNPWIAAISFAVERRNIDGGEG